VATPLNAVERALERIVSELTNVGVPYALVGGLAVSARVEPRTTRDVDIAVFVDSDEGAESLIFQLQSRGYIVKMLLEQERTGRIATVRLIRDTERGVYVDLLFASSGIEDSVVAAAEELVVLEALPIRVATRGHLIAMKVLARDDRQRPQDWDDLRALLQDATKEDVRQAQEALTAITARSYNRGRDLGADLTRAIIDTTG
jgi:predicted nucleotidyltransferase